MSRSPALTLAALLIGLVGAALFITLPENPWFLNGELKLAFLVFQGLVALQLAHLVWGRFRVGARTSDRALTIALLVLAFTNLLLAGWEISDRVANDPVVGWVPLIATAIAAVLLCRAALAPARETERKISLWLLTAVVVVGIAAVTAAVIALGDSLPDVLPAGQDVFAVIGPIQLDPSLTDIDLFTAHPVVIVGSAVLAILFLIAAIAFTRNARREGTELHGWLAAASMLAALAAISYAMLPSVYSDAPEGVDSTWFDRLYAGDLLDFGAFLLLFVAAWRIIEVQRARLEKTEEEIHHLTLIDELTGLRNRRGFAAAAGPVLKLAARGKSTVTVLFVDLDNLDGINESFGRDQGDRALQATAAILNASVRDSDVVCRLDDNQFCILLSPGSRPQAVLDRIKEGLADQEEKSTEEWMLSLGIGSTTFDPELDMAIQEMIEKADAAVFLTADDRVKAKADVL